MPIEIREIVIKATVNPGDSSLTGGSNSSTSTPSSSGGSIDVIQESVEQVMQIINDKKER